MMKCIQTRKEGVGVEVEVALLQVAAALRTRRGQVLVVAGQMSPEKRRVRLRARRLRRHPLPPRHHPRRRRYARR